MSKRKTDPPTVIFELIECMKPGRVGETDVIIANTARQFYVSTSAKFVRTRTCTYKAIGITVTTLWLIHCRNINLAPVD